MKILIKSAKIYSPGSKWHLKEASVLISNGKITEIGKKVSSGDKEIEGKGRWLTPGWMDSWAQFHDPGFEHKEDTTTGSEAAASGGFTGVVLVPNTNPVIDTKNQIKYLIKGNQYQLTTIYPLAAVTKGTGGDDLTEMIDLLEAGAVAFSDGFIPISDGEVLMKSLQYLQKSNSLIIQRPEDTGLNNNGSMNEGVVSTMLGLKGIPALAEEVIIQRDLSILEYAGGRLHFANVSSEKSLDMIRKAKKKGLEVSCSVASYQANYADEDIAEFDTNFKINPPFRTKSDNRAILKALKDGTIDIINSNHLPQDVESKKLEFDLAEFGIISLQTVASDIAKMMEKVPVEHLLHKISIKPRELFNIDIPEIKKGEVAELTLFDPKMEWDYNPESNSSKSVNSPYVGQRLKGKAVFVINNKEYLINE